MACLMSAALAYHVPVPAMQGIQAVEGGQEGQEVCQNADGSCDLGPFQVNDHAWVQTIAQDLGADPATVRTTLRDDACWNAQIAAWILRQMLDEANGDLPTAIGNYHSHLPLEHMIYRAKVQEALDRLYPTGVVPDMTDAVAGLVPGGFKLPPLVPDKYMAHQEGPSARLIMVGGRAPASTAIVRHWPTAAEARADAVRPDGSRDDGSRDDGASTIQDKPLDTMRYGRSHRGGTTVFRGNLERTQVEAGRAQRALDAAAAAANSDGE